MKTRDRIKLGCIHLGISQKELAEKIGTSKQEVAHVGAGRYRSGRIVDGIAAVFGVTPEWLVDGVGVHPPWASGSIAPPVDQSPSGKLREAHAIIYELSQQLAAQRLQNQRLSEQLEEQIAARARASGGARGRRRSPRSAGR